MSLPALFHRWTGPTRVSRRSPVQSGVHFPIRRRYPSLRLTSGLITVRFPSPPSSYFSSYAAEEEPQPQPEPEPEPEPELGSGDTNFDFRVIELSERVLQNGNSVYNGTFIVRYRAGFTNDDFRIPFQLTTRMRVEDLMLTIGLQWCRKMFLEFVQSMRSFSSLKMGR